MHLPTASRPRPNFRAKASFTIATFGVPAASAAVNSRPASERHAEACGSSRRRPRCSASWRRCRGRARSPAPTRRSPSCRPPAAGPRAAVTAVTPGRAASSSSTPLEEAARAGGVVAVAARARCAKVTTLSTFSPRSTRLTLQQALEEEPGRDEQRHGERDLRRHQRRAEARRGARRRTSCPAPARMVVTRSGRVLCSAGNMPKSKPRADRQRRRRRASPSGAAWSVEARWRPPSGRMRAR